MAGTPDEMLFVEYFEVNGEPYSARIEHQNCHDTDIQRFALAYGSERERFARYCLAIAYELIGERLAVVIPEIVNSGRAYPEVYANRT